MPRALGGGAARDGRAGGVEQRLVVEQREVGVEDRRLGVAGAARRPPARSRAIASRAAASASSRRSRSRSGSSAARSGGGPAGAAEVARGPDGDAGRGRARRRARRPAPGAATSAGSAAGGGAAGAGGRRRRAAAMPSPKPSSASARSAVERLGGLRPRRGDDQGVAEARAERDDVGQARRAHGRAAALLGHADLGVVVAHRRRRSSAAGRACRPIALRTSRRASASGAASVGLGCLGRRVRGASPRRRAARPSWPARRAPRRPPPRATRRRARPPPRPPCPPRAAPRSSARVRRPRASRSRTRRS